MTPPLALPVEEILTSAPLPPEHPVRRQVGASRQGRALCGMRFGSGPLRLSLIAGCHADEPVGPAMLERLASWLAAQPVEAPILRVTTLSLVPDANPDGAAANAAWSERRRPMEDSEGRPDEGYDLSLYLSRAVRELPGEDVEFGFPRDETDSATRPENLAVARFLAEGGPYALHATFHSMAFAQGPWFLQERGWIERTEGFRTALCRRVEEMSYQLHDVDRRGEKGFHRIGPGFCTRPDSRAMASHFIERGDAEMAARFRPSSMEFVRSLGGDPLTLVSEMPLFLLPNDLEGHAGQADAPPLPTGTEGRLAFIAWAQEQKTMRGPGGFHDHAASFGIRPMPLGDQMRLQLAMLEAAVAAVVEDEGL